MKYYRIRNLSKYQHYRDRTPPWVKLHRSIIGSYPLCDCDSTTKWHAVALILLASEMDNRIPDDPWYIRNRLMLKEQPRLETLEEIGFLECAQDASSALATCSSKRDSERESEGERDRGRTRARRASAGPPPGFTAWWETYPRKVGKQAAAKAWRRLKLEPEAERIIAATVAHAKSEQWRRDGGQYVPNPLTYLNQGRYDDPPPDQQTSNVTPFKNYLLDEDGA